MNKIMNRRNFLTTVIAITTAFLSGKIAFAEAKPDILEVEIRKYLTSLVQKGYIISDMSLIVTPSKSSYIKVYSVACNGETIVQGGQDIPVAASYERHFVMDMLGRLSKEFGCVFKPSLVHQLEGIHTIWTTK